MNKLSIKHLIFICSAILFSLIIVFIVQFKNEKKLSHYYTELVSIDSKIEARFYSDAVDSLNKIYYEVYNSRTAKMFLKRVDNISEDLEDYSLLMNYSLELYKEYKNDEDIAAIYAFSLQKTGNFNDSIYITENNFSDPRFTSLHLTNILLSGDLNKASRITEKDAGNYYFLFDSPEISAEAFEEAAVKLNDQRFFLDAALKYVDEKNFNTAAQILFKTPKISFPEVKAILSYDNNDFKAALGYLDMLPAGKVESSLGFIVCDILMYNGLFEAAAEIYREYIKNYPDAGILPYRNLYAIYNDYDQRHKWLSEGLKLYPDNDDLLVSLAWESYIKNDLDTVADIMNKVDLSNTSIELFKLNLMLTGRNPEHVIGNFWNLFNAAPDSEIVAVSFANYLLKNKQFDQLDLLLKRYIAASGEQDWIFNYYAVSNAMAGKYKAAEAMINKAVEVDDNIPNNFNKAVILSKMQHYSEAASVLEKTLMISDSPDGKSDYISKIYYRLAENSYNTGDYISADKYINKLTALFPADLKSSLLKKKIQEKI